jgi:hypothetical protein
MFNFALCQHKNLNLRHYSALNRLKTGLIAERKTEIPIKTAFPWIITGFQANIFKINFLKFVDNVQF